MSGPQFPHDELEELIVADALDGLSELEHRRMVQEMERHGPDCQDCNRLVAEYAEVASRLAFSVPPAQMSAGAEDRLLRAAMSEAPAAESITGPIPVEPTDKPGRRTVSRLRRFVAAASVAAALVLLGGIAGRLIAPRNPGANAGLIAFISQPGARVVPLDSTPGQPTGQQLAVAFRPGARDAWVFGNLPALPDDKVYELWYQPAPSATVQPAGVFLPRDGTVTAHTTLGESFVALAVSIEPAGGSPQPTSDPIFLTGV